MSSQFEAAQHYFDALWQDAESAYTANQYIVPKDRDLNTPLGYVCLSTVARLVRQSNAPVEEIQATQRAFQEHTTGQFLYPLESIHISLLGCTPRLPSKAGFPEARTAVIRAVCQKVLRDALPVPLTLQGVGITGSQVFIQVFPHDGRWARLRQELETELLALGEQPISYPNKLPIHMNFLRIKNDHPDELRTIFNLVRRFRSLEVGDYPVDCVELQWNDFVVSPGSIDGIAQYTSQIPGAPAPCPD